MNEHFMDAQDEDGVYLNFKPVWFENFGWYLESTKSGKTYNPLEMVGTYMETHPESSLKSVYDQYLPFLQNACFYPVTPKFAFHWMKHMLMYEALQYREDKRVAFLTENLKKDLSSKEVGKIHKGSEKAYQDGYAEFFSKFTTF